ncbi:hypothetical protein F4778DRAFT_783565 [Xylariomycetidae sp. FL2044]|nr:hypothetical protein F4778DRAFT_783565 [Xylariomycetidae sp. FL2044]
MPSLSRYRTTTPLKGHSPSSTRRSGSSRAVDTGLPTADGHGCEHSEYIVTAPFPPEAFSLATRELQGGAILEMDSLPMRGPYPIVCGEY